MQDYMALQEMIRIQFQTKQKTSLKMVDLVKAVNYGQNRFKNNLNIAIMINQLAQIVPDFISVKQLIIQGQKTKFVKFGQQKMTSVQVGAVLKQKIGALVQSDPAKIEQEAPTNNKVKANQLAIGANTTKKGSEKQVKNV